MSTDYGLVVLVAIHFLHMLGNIKDIKVCQLKASNEDKIAA